MLGLGHEVVFVIGENTRDHFRSLRLPGNHYGLSRLALPKNLVAENEGHFPCFLHTAMAGDAVLVQDGLHVAGEIDLRTERLRSDGGGEEWKWDFQSWNEW